VEELLLDVAGVFTEFLFDEGVVFLLAGVGLISEVKGGQDSLSPNV